MSEKFKVGDKVKGLGMEGVVTNVGSSGTHTVAVTFLAKNTYHTYHFTEDGRFITQGEPCLELLERPKQKVKRTYYRAVTYYKGNALNYLYKTGYYAKKELLMKENTNIVEIEEKEFEIEE